MTSLSRTKGQCVMSSVTTSTLCCLDCRVTTVLITCLVSLAVFLRLSFAGTLHMLSKSQTWTLDSGQSVNLECEFLAERFNLFDNPIVWRKRQFRPTFPQPAKTTARIAPMSAVTASPTLGEHSVLEVNIDHQTNDEVINEELDLLDSSEIVVTTTPSTWDSNEEQTQINMMGNLVEPFASARRFRATFNGQAMKAPSYLFGLNISNISMVDVGNYTCEVGGPQNTVLASVTHRLFVRANVDYVILTDDDNVTSSSELSPDLHKPALVYVEGQRGTLRCLAVGGQPSPVVSIQLAGGRFATSLEGARSLDVPQTMTVSVQGRRGLRLVRQVTERSTRSFIASTDDDGLDIKCFAMVIGLPPLVASSHIVVHYSAVITCVDNTASVGDRNVHVRCDVRAKPEVVHLRWIIDDNGTTVTEGEVINEYWTLVMDRTDGVMEVQLFMRQARENCFRIYTLIAENGVAVKRQTVALINKATLAPSSSLQTRTGNSGYSFHRVDTSSQVTSGSSHVTSLLLSRTNVFIMTLCFTRFIRSLVCR